MKKLNNQFEYWDQVSSLKTFTHPLDMDRFKSYVPTNGKILDFGCGYGRTCHELYKLGFRNIIGIDSSEMMIARGRQEYQELTLMTLESDDIPFQQDEFDTIILFAVLTCIPTNEGQRNLINKLKQILRPGGIIYISDYWLQNNDRNLKRYNAYKDKYGVYGVFELPEGAVVRHHDKEWISSMLCDFNTLALFDIEVTTMNGNKSSGFQYFGRKAYEQGDLI